VSLRTAVLILCIAFAAVVAANAFYILPRLTRQADENTRASVALCALRVDLQRRVAAAKNFLAEHPNGIPGIPARTFRDGIDNQQRTISALTVLRCPPMAAVP
jgi:hypothetical protein